MLSVGQAELTPDLAKSALHFEYEFVELTWFACTMVTSACPDRAYTYSFLNLMDDLLVTAKS
jgi:hypothetical protein